LLGSDDRLGEIMALDASAKVAAKNRPRGHMAGVFFCLMAITSVGVFVAGLGD
jgi:hypothetical protein